VEARPGVPCVREVCVVANLVGVVALMITVVPAAKASAVVRAEETLVVSSQVRSLMRCLNIEMMVDALAGDSTLTMLSSQLPMPSLALALLVMLTLVKGRSLLSWAKPLMKLLVRLISLKPNHSA